MAGSEYLGTRRHANDPATEDRRVLACVKCGDRHTVDVADLLAEAHADALRDAAERARRAIDKYLADVKPWDRKETALADAVLAELQPEAQPAGAPSRLNAESMPSVPDLPPRDETGRWTNQPAGAPEPRTSGLRWTGPDTTCGRCGHAPHPGDNCPNCGECPDPGEHP